MKKYCFIFCFLICSLAAIAQGGSYQLIKTIEGDITNAAIDNLQNLYVLTSTDQLKKFGSKGDSIGVYNNIKLGRIHSIDVTNPLRLVVFYKDFSTVVLLDRFLAPRSTIDLRKQNIIQPTAVSLSYDNHLWLFDAMENKLKKVSEEGVLQTTVDFRMLFGEAVVPEQILDQNGFVYLYDSRNGIYIFDYYGAFKRKLPITQWQNIAVLDKQIAGVYNEEVNFYHLSTFQQSQRKLPLNAGKFQHYIITNTNLVGVSKNRLDFYSFR